MKKYLFIYICLSVFTGCINKDFSKEEKYLKGKTYLRILKTEPNYVLIEPCDASIPKLRFSEVLYIDYGQEDDEFDKWNVKAIVKDTIKVSVYYKGKIQDYIMDIRIDSLNHYLYYDNDVYIDSLYANTLPYVKSPCIECRDKETCDYLALQEKLKKLDITFGAPKNWRGAFANNYMEENFEITIYVDADNSEITYNYINDVTKSYFSIDCCYKEVNNELYLYYSGWHDPDEVRNAEFKLDTTPIIKLYRKDDVYYAKDIQHLEGYNNIELHEM